MGPWSGAALLLSLFLSLGDPLCPACSTAAEVCVVFAATKVVHSTLIALGGDTPLLPKALFKGGVWWGCVSVACGV